MAWALKSNGWILENQFAIPHQMVCGSFGGVSEDHGLHKGDILPNEWSPRDQLEHNWLDQE